LVISQHAREHVELVPPRREIGRAGLIVELFGAEKLSA